VTTVVMGNCGFAVAPTRPAHRDLILRTLENVEGMSIDAIRAGIGEHWPFETIPRVPRRHRAPRHRDQRRLAGRHTAVRLYVMGEEATEREATRTMIAQMRVIVGEGLRAGALGFATSKSPTHVGYAGRPCRAVPRPWRRSKRWRAAWPTSSTASCRRPIGSGFFLDEFAAIHAATASR
jgi:N-acyl-D-aspartate/D-glutamate deacylase